MDEEGVCGSTAVFCDIWSTCLTRTCAFPADVFRETARNYLALRPAENRHGLEREIFRQRHAAELLARQAAPNGEASLNEIYSAWNGINDLNLDLDLFCFLELETEEASCRPILKMREVLNRFREEGRRVLFLSDMYLPSAFLEELLRRHGFFKETDAIYVSNELRANKRSGRMFVKVLEMEKLSARDCIHIGDHVVADCEAPRRFGIEPRLFTGCRFNRYELQALRFLRADPAAAGQVAGAMQSTRLCALSGDNGGHDWLAGVAAPLLTFFTADTIRQAREKKLKRLYFLSRDAEVLLQIARTLPRNPGDPELRYLFSSRKSWGAAAIDPDDTNSVRWLRTAPHRPGKLLEELGFTPSESEAIFHECPLKLDADRTYPAEELTPFWEVVTQRKWLNLAAERAKGKRADLISYLASEGMTDGSPFGIVDVGWFLNVQASLRRLLRKYDDTSPRLEGFYLFCRRERAPLSETGAWQAWYSEEEGGDPAVQSFAEKGSGHSPVIEELFFRTPAASVTGFSRGPDGGVHPDYQCSGPTPGDIVFCGRLRSAAIEFARTIGPNAESLAARPDIRLLCGSLLETLLDSPRPREARELIHASHVSDSLHDPRNSIPIVRAYGFRDVANVLKQRLTRRHGSGSAPVRLWEAGSRSISHPFILLLLRLAMTSPRGWWRHRRASAAGG